MWLFFQHLFLPLNCKSDKERDYGLVLRGVVSGFVFSLIIGLCGFILIVCLTLCFQNLIATL